MKNHRPVAQGVVRLDMKPIVVAVWQALYWMERRHLVMRGIPWANQ